jgi:hypothetical protein
MVLAALIIGTGCERELSVTLVDRREPRPGLVPERVEWRVVVRRGDSPPDTIPKVRVKFAPTVRRDSIVGVSTQDGYANATFAYNVRRHTFKRSILPEWYGEVVEQSTPAFSPDGEYLGYVATDAQGGVTVVVRSWATGIVQARGLPQPGLTVNTPPTVEWLEGRAFVARYSLGEPPNDIRVEARGKIGQASVLLDTIVNAPVTIAGAPVATLHVDTGPPPETEWTIAARQIRRLAPAASPELPKPFIAELEQLGCTVPQSDYSGGRTNVIQGSFGAAGQHDWAVLCSRGGASVILVYWGGPAQCPRELRSASDAGYLQGLGEGRIGFSRGISKTRSYHEYIDETDTVSVDRGVQLDHDAIDDAFEGKASSVLFCRNGIWVTFSGAD